MHLRVALLLVCCVAMTAGWGRWGKRDLYMNERTEENMSEAFKMLDGNKDGVVDLEELKNDLHTVMKGETRSAEELMKDADTNGDGEIEEDEFTAEMEHASPAEYLSRRFDGPPPPPKRWFGWRRRYARRFSRRFFGH